MTGEFKRLDYKDDEEEASSSGEIKVTSELKEVIKEIRREKRRAYLMTLLANLKSSS